MDAERMTKKRQQQNKTKHLKTHTESLDPN